MTSLPCVTGHPFQSERAGYGIHGDHKDGAKKVVGDRGFERSDECFGGSSPVWRFNANGQGLAKTRQRMWGSRLFVRFDVSTLAKRVERWRKKKMPRISTSFCFDMVYFCPTSLPLYVGASPNCYSASPVAIVTKFKSDNSNS